MKKIIRSIAFILILALVAPLALNVSVSAASYPLIMVDYNESSKTIMKGETGQIRFTIMPEYHNEKYHVFIYDSNGTRVASAENSYYNTDGTGIRYVTINIDTAELDMAVGTYKAEYWLSFYSLYSWHDAPNKYTYTFQVTPYVCTGAHVYDSNCDTTCNACGETRSVVHTYSGNCDASCNICGATRTASGSHSYSNSTDTVCNTCGHTRVIIEQDNSTVIASGTCGANLTWKLTQKGTLTISGTGNMYSYSSSSLAPWGDYECRSKIKAVVVSEGVTSIGNYAFYFCTDIEKVSIPSTVTKLGENCYSNCRSLRQVVLPAGIRAIPKFAFTGCDVLETILIPSSVQSFGQNCFDDCSSLQYFIIPNGVTKIAYGMFWNCSSLEYVQIPNSVTSIDTFAFHECGNLSDIYFTGSSSQWQAIEISSLESFNGGLLNATIHYNSKAPCVVCTFGAWTSISTNSHQHTCTNCGNKETANHHWDQGVVTKQPTCAATGVKTYTCADCGGTKTETITKTTNHTYNNWTKVDNANHSHTCSLCSRIETTAHKWDYGTITVMPTLETTGLREHTCADCGATKTAVVPKRASGDLNGDLEINNKDVEYLLWYTLFPESYPLEIFADFDGNGTVDNKDVEYLLWHTLFPETYPL